MAAITDVGDMGAHADRQGLARTCHVRLLSPQLDTHAGSHKYDLELARRLAERGHRVSVVCFSATEHAGNSVEVHQLGHGQYRDRRLLWRLAHYLEYRRCSGLLRRLDLSESDIVIGTNHLLLKEYVRKYPETPLIYLPHSMIAPREIESYEMPLSARLISGCLLSALQRWALNRADRTVRFTEAGCRALLDYYGRRIRPRFVVNPMPVDVPVAKESRDWRSGELQLLFVGRLIPSKNVALLLTCMSRLAGAPCRLDIVGDGGDRGNLERMTDALGLRDRVVFHGRQFNVEPWYRQADLFVFPSRLENCPLVLLEAMSFGVPCVAMRSDGVAYVNAHEELIRDGVTGILAINDEDFFARVKEAVQWRSALMQMGQAAREFVTQHHSWSVHLDRYQSLFEELPPGRRFDPERECLTGGAKSGRIWPSGELSGNPAEPC